MFSSRYRLRASTAAVVVDHADAHPAILVIPEGEIVAAVAKQGKFTKVLWNGRKLAVFTVDLADRGEIVAGAGG
jgi:hypothetical protein